MKNTVVAILILALASPAALAHEGHDHDAPGVVEAPKGGLIKSLELTHVEVVAKGQDVKIYLSDKAMKPQDVKGYKVSARAEPPRGKKAENVALTAKGNFFEGRYDAKGMHRYTLAVAIVDPKTGHNDRLNFTIEPRK